MDYKGKFPIFDPRAIQTYPASSRTNKVKIKDLLEPAAAMQMNIDLPQKTVADIDTIAAATVEMHKAGKPVILFTGAHLVKNGLGLLIADLIRRGLLNMVSGNGATSIHDFELALFGETSEYVPQALEKGQFGMAYEFKYINAALSIGNKYKLGYGESLGKMICEQSFRDEVMSTLDPADSKMVFKNPEVSMIAACRDKGIPFTVHVSIGTDVIDQHANFDGEAKGGCSGRDFLIYTSQVGKLKDGGLVLNIGSAITGAEVLLKAVSMVANAGSGPKGIITADFDLRSFDPKQSVNESSQGYYFRDQKSVVTRIPEAFGGKGCYIEGNQKQTVVMLYKKIIEKL